MQHKRQMLLVPAALVGCLQVPDVPAPRGTDVSLYAGSSAVPELRLAECSVEETSTAAGELTPLLNIDGLERLRECCGLSVVFYASGACRSCRAVRPKLERLSLDFDSTVSFYSVDILKARPVFARERVASLPWAHLHVAAIGRVASFACGPRTGATVLRNHLITLTQPETIDALCSLGRDAALPLARFHAVCGLSRALESAASAGGGGLQLSAQARRPPDSEAVARELPRLFAALDADSDGAISAADLQAGLGSLGAAEGSTPHRLSLAGEERLGEMLRDASGRPSLGPAEFRALWHRGVAKDGARPEGDLLASFRALGGDGEGEGSVPLEEVARRLEAAQRGSVLGVREGEAGAGGRAAQDEDQTRALLHAFDFEAAGQLSMAGLGRVLGGRELL